MSSTFATATEFCELTGMAMPTDLARLQSLLQMASALIQRYTDQTLHQVTNEQVVLGPVERPSLLLPERPVTAISQVLVEGSAVTDFWFERPGILNRGTVTGTIGVNWSKGATVTYTHGYAETEPEFLAIKTIAIDVAKRAYTADESGQALAQGGIPVETIGFPTALFLTPNEKWDLMDLGKVGVG